MGKSSSFPPSFLPFFFLCLSLLVSFLAVGLYPFILFFFLSFFFFTRARFFWRKNGRKKTKQNKTKQNKNKNKSKNLRSRENGNDSTSIPNEIRRTTEKKKKNRNRNRKMRKERETKKGTVRGSGESAAAAASEVPPSVMRQRGRRRPADGGGHSSSSRIRRRYCSREQSWLAQEDFFARMTLHADDDLEWARNAVDETPQHFWKCIETWGVPPSTSGKLLATVDSILNQTVKALENHVTESADQNVQNCTFATIAAIARALQSPLLKVCCSTDDFSPVLTHAEPLHKALLSQIRSLSMRNQNYECIVPAAEAAREIQMLLPTPPRSWLSGNLVKHCSSARQTFRPLSAPVFAHAMKRYWKI